MKFKKTIIEVISLLLVILWVYAGLSKLLDYETSRFQLGRSPFLEHFAGIVAWAIPVSEILVAIGLLIPRTRLASLYASFALMLMFTGYIYLILNHSYYIPCSCGGVLSGMDWYTHLWFNIGFTTLALTAIILSVSGGTKHFDHSYFQAS